MKNGWLGVLGLVAGCAGASAPQSAAPGAETQGAEATAAAPDVTSATSDKTQGAGAQDTDESKPSDGRGEGAESNAKQSSGCTPLPNSEPKVVSGENRASDLGDTGRTFILNVAGVSVELPPCTPGADTEVLELSWETQDRPTSSHVHPDFSRHGATVRLPIPVEAAEGAPLRLHLNSHRPLTKPGQKFVAAVETSGACEGRFKRAPLEFGGCSHWKIYDATFDASVQNMVAEVPELGGYRIQFGWMPAKR